jgi:2-keto-4-pentenoate hydratase/2-oxohepta-3-ene-1,7-dioic acid hydratase in catechol pathway
VIVTSKDVTDVSVGDPKNYILGYSIVTDLTARLFQDTKNGGGQFSFAKSFDKFAPIGPTLISASHFAIDESSLQTRVTRISKQDSRLDFIQSPEKLVSFLNTGYSDGDTIFDATVNLTLTGTTIPAGTAIMTGTPAGVGLFRNPPQQLKDGDFIEVEVVPLGVLWNQVVLDSTNESASR